MTSFTQDEAIIAQYKAAQNEFSENHAKTTLKLTNLAKGIKLVTPKCARVVELNRLLVDQPQEYKDHMETIEIIIQKLHSQMASLDHNQKDYPTRNADLVQALTHHRKVRHDFVYAYVKPISIELDNILYWFQTSGANAIKAEMLQMIVSINKRLPSSQKIDLNNDHDTLITLNADAIEVRMEDRLKAHANKLTMHICDKTEISLLMASYKLAMFKLDGTHPDIVPIRTDLARAIRAVSQECCICLDHIMAGSVTTKCKHVLHRECFNTWITLNTSCPLCRAVVDPMDCISK
jgi:hypothetical protein